MLLCTFTNIVGPFHHKMIILHPYYCAKPTCLETPMFKKNALEFVWWFFFTNTYVNNYMDRKLWMRLIILFLVSIPSKKIWWVFLQYHIGRIAPSIPISRAFDIYLFIYLEHFWFTTFRVSVPHWGRGIENKVNQKGFWGTRLDEDIHPTWLSFHSQGGNLLLPFLHPSPQPPSPLPLVSLWPWLAPSLLD